MCRRLRHSDGGSSIGDCSSSSRPLTGRPVFCVNRRTSRSSDKEIGRDLARQNIRYVGAHFSPTVFGQRCLHNLLPALRTGLDATPSVDVRLIAELGRNLGPAGAMRTLDQVAELRELKIVGIGLGRFKPQYANELFRRGYRGARGLGFGRQRTRANRPVRRGVWGAIHTLEQTASAMRRAPSRTPSSYGTWRNNEFLWSSVPLSNVRTAVVTSVANHPLRRYFDAGIPVSLNTDDPLFSAAPCVDEMAAATGARSLLATTLNGSSSRRLRCRG